MPTSVSDPSIPEPRRPADRTISVVAAISAVVCIVVVSLTVLGPRGLRAASRVGAGVRWDDAYRALQVKLARPGNSPDRERLYLANAMAESEAPGGAVPGPRIHPAGTLARLKYETFDPDGQPGDEWEVRALVPPLPALDENGGEDSPLLGRNGCPAECVAEIARGGFLLHRSGDPGLAAEWVLRMPVNQAFDLGARPITTHDVLDKRPRRLSIESRRRDGRDVREPANVRVTLLDACAGRARIGSVTHLEFSPRANALIPLRFRTSKWVQLDDCGTPAPLPPPPEPIAPERQKPAPRPVIHAVTLRRATGTGLDSLVVNESWFLRNPKPVEFSLQLTCRYEPAADRWTRLPPLLKAGTMRITARPSGEPRAQERVVVNLPSEVALFWLQWIERAEGDRLIGTESVHETLAPSGPMLCNDVDLGPAPPGREPACVPFTDRAVARFVPAARETCAR